MKKIFLATSALVALIAVPAGAADMAVKYRPPAPVVPVCAQFGGFYIGAHAGWGYYDHKWHDRDAWSQEEDIELHRNSINNTKSGFIGGVQGGYNWQNNCTVFGVEVDYAWGRINAESLDTDGDPGAALDQLTVSSRFKGIGTVKARTGIVVDNLLLYVTGGFAFANFDRAYAVIDVGGGDNETFAHRNNRWGWVAGFGTEWAINQNWSIKSEVNYARFERNETSFNCVIQCAPDRNVRFEDQDSIWTTKIGVNYRFGGYGVVAKY
jgi:outer membrane immunogenic protein